MIIKTQGIVLKSFDFRETSRIATFFTVDQGKVSGILKGIRTDHRKFRSSVDRFSVNDIVYYQYRNSDLHLISQCDLRQFFHPVRQDLRKSLAASYMGELVNALMPVEETNQKVFELMIEYLNSLEGEGDVDQLVHMFQIKMLLFSGFRPHLDACVVCKQQIENDARFSLKEGGLVCERCPSPDPEVHLVSRGTVASILHVEKSEWPMCLKLKFTDNVKKELKYVLNNFLVFHLGRRLKSAKYLSSASNGKELVR